MVNSPAAPLDLFRSMEITDRSLGGEVISLKIVKLSVLILAVIGQWVCNGRSCWLSSCSVSKLIYVLRWQFLSVSSCTDETILFQWLLPSSFTFLQRISSMTGWSTVLCCIDQSQCFQLHVYVWNVKGRIFLRSWPSSSIHFYNGCLLLAKNMWRSDFRGWIYI